jgi:hypothetical protein
MVLRARGDDNATLEKCDQVTIDSVRNHSGRHFPVQNASHWRFAGHPGGVMGWLLWWARPACSCRALVTSGKWLNAWGLLPSCRPVWGSHSSLSSPTSLRRASSRSNSWVASVCWPARCSASTSQKEQARNRPSPKGVAVGVVAVG